MSQRIVIDCLPFARDARVLQGELPIAIFERVQDMLTDSVGFVRYRVEGAVGPRNRAQLHLQLDGVLSLCCQRCLEGVGFQLQVANVLEFIDNEDELTQEELEDDSKDFLPAQSEVDVVALIEDEIILGLPSAPRHESCALPSAAQEDGVVSPFAVLKSLKPKAQ